MSHLPASKAALSQFVKRLAISLLLLSVAFANGWHLPMVQGFAWFQMFNVYSQKVPASEALDIIFSGKEPCCICDFVSGCKTENEKTWNQWHSQKTILIVGCNQRHGLKVPQNQRQIAGNYQFYLPLLYEDKETPPPKTSVS